MAQLVYFATGLIIGLSAGAIYVYLRAIVRGYAFYPHIILAATWAIAVTVIAAMATGGNERIVLLAADATGIAALVNLIGRYRGRR